MKTRLLRVFSLALCVFLILSICGCGKQAKDQEIMYQYEYEYVGGNSNMESSKNESFISQTPNTTVSSQGQSTESTQFSDALPFTFEEYMHKSITISLYDSSCNTYGFTWNSIGKPINPVLKLCQGNTFNEAKCQEFSVNYEMCETYFNESASSLYYVSKAVVSELEPNKEYTYQVCDNGAKVYSVPATFTTSNPSDSSFTFLHFSDSQVLGTKDDIALGADTGIAFGNVLAAATANCPSPAFMLHTGDIVEWSKYEGYWENMLHFNEKYFRKYPFAVISGNHETIYRNGKNEIYKHFNIKTGGQKTEKGFYYYFDYSNTRFIMLNTYDATSDKKLKDDQMSWLTQLLSNNPKKWTIVAMHNPLYSAGYWGSNPEHTAATEALREQLSSLFTKYNVDLVLQGHDHLFSRTHPIAENGSPITNTETKTINSVKHYVKPKGTIYAMHGVSGTQSKPFYSKYDSSYYAFVEDTNTNANSWAEISVDNEKITVKVYSATNGTTKLIDSYGITK